MAEFFRESPAMKAFIEKAKTLNLVPLPPPYPSGLYVFNQAQNAQDSYAQWAGLPAGAQNAYNNYGSANPLSQFIGLGFQR